MTKEIPNDVSIANKDSALDSLLSQVESGVLPEVPIGLRGAVAAAVANGPVEMDAAWAERLGRDISLEEQKHVWERFEGGAPVDTTYFWCHRCGAFCEDPSGDPKTFYTPKAIPWPGPERDRRGYLVGQPDEPPCIDVIEIAPQFPDTLEPKRTFRWMFESPYLDVFLVKKVTLPKITFENDKMKAASLMEVEVYDFIAPNGSEQVLRMAHAASGPSGVITKIKLLDAIGTVVSMWEFRVKLAHVEHPVLDYAVNELLVLKVFLEVVEMKLVW